MVSTKSNKIKTFPSKFTPGLTVSVDIDEYLGENFVCVSVYMSNVMKSTISITPEHAEELATALEYAAHLIKNGGTQHE